MVKNLDARRRPCVLAAAALVSAAAIWSGLSCAADPPDSAATTKQNAPPVPAPPDKNPPSVVSKADVPVLDDFNVRVKEYLALHRKLEGTLPALPKELTPEQIDKRQRELGTLIKNARKGAKRGALFTPATEAYVKRAFAKTFTGSDGKLLKASIMDENPGLPAIAVNERYPDEVPLSTMPPEVLTVLPKLEEDLEYRFIGDRLILFDAHAHIIVDFTNPVLPK